MSTAMTHADQLNCDLQCVVAHLASKGIYDEFLRTVEYEKNQPHCNDVLAKLRSYFFTDVGLFRTSKNIKIVDCIEKNFVTTGAQENYLHLHSIKQIGIGWRIWRYWSYEEKTLSLHETLFDAMRKIESLCNQLARNHVGDYERHF